MSAEVPAEETGATPGGGPDPVAEETRRLRDLQRIVALASQTIATQVRTKGEALAVLEGTRRRALELFPGSEDTFDLIYRPRLLRLYRARFEAGTGEDET